MPAKEQIESFDPDTEYGWVSELRRFAGAQQEI